MTQVISADHNESIHHGVQTHGDSGEEQFSFNMKRPSAEPGPMEAFICHDQNTTGWLRKEKTQ